MKSVENEWEQTAMKNAAAPIAAKTQQQIDRNNGKPWRSRIALRLKPPDVLSSRLQTLQRVCRYELERRTHQIRTFYSLVAPSEEKQPSYQLKGPTSPRIVTSKQHSKHTWMRPIVLSIHSFVISQTPYCPLIAWSKSSIYFWEFLF